MGFVSEELNETEKQLIKDGKASNMAVVYGKEASIWKVRPAGPQIPSPTLGPQELPTPQPWTVETAPTSGQKRTAVGNTGLGLLPHSPSCPHSLQQIQTASSPTLARVDTQTL